jgi:hypothetical protein
MGWGLCVKQTALVQQAEAMQDRAALSSAMEHVQELDAIGAARARGCKPAALWVLYCLCSACAPSSRAVLEHQHYARQSRADVLTYFPGACQITADRGLSARCSCYEGAGNKRLQRLAEQQQRS